MPRSSENALGGPIRWVRLRDEPSTDWHVADRPAVLNEDVVLTTLCGEILGRPEETERAGFGLVVGNRCRSCQGVLLNERGQD